MKNTVASAEFKAHCLRLLDEVATERKTLIITKRGKPVAQIVPMPAQEDIFGAMRGSGEILGDIISPIDAEWEALKD